ncbi:MAG: hypothetical protein OEV91_07010 [Desulfobulbaceae bacterium]|nr:hypothetical protein [Desulfobulbaceae bacterium]
MMRNRLRVVALSILLTTMAGCNSVPDLPFQYSYTSRDTVEVVLNGVTYTSAGTRRPPLTCPFSTALSRTVTWTS